MPEPRTAVIVDVCRTPVGRAGKGSLIDVRPDDLAAFVLRALLERHPQIDPAEIDDLACGCAFPWGEQGYNVGRNVGLLAGLPHHVPGFTVTRLCASSLQALRIAGHAVALGEAEIVAVAGVESVSRVGHGHHLAEKNPALDPAAPGPTAAEVFLPMGVTAENVADRWGIGREEMDRFAQRSQERAVAARESGFSAREIVPFTRADGSVVEDDDGPRPSSSLEKRKIGATGPKVSSRASSIAGLASSSTVGW